ncbi:hypothetical protein [Actinoplanes sp. CA-252034]|uniref:hypothetical protein n=1 Tax=Actinoplanes sp. CA-252034 TaxID=3239906 RepID=UPI003D994C53
MRKTGTVRIPTLAGYTMLKLVAWLDRGVNGEYKDASPPLTGPTQRNVGVGWFRAWNVASESEVTTAVPQRVQDDEPSVELMSAYLNLGERAQRLKTTIGDQRG